MGDNSTVTTVDQTAINDQFISKIKSSVIFDSNWNNALNAIPTSIALLAKCNAYSSLPATADVTLGDLKNFTLFKSGNLAGCLTEVVNKCLLAFNLAATNLGDINERAGDVFDVLSANLFPDLQELENNPSATALATVKIDMETLRNTATKAQNRVALISAQFDEVLALAMELNRASVEKGAMSAKDAKVAQLAAYSASVRLQGEQTAVNSAQSAVDTLKGTLKTTQDAYQKASDEFPSTMQVLGASVAMAFTDCLTSAVAQAVPVLVANYGVAGKIQSGVNVGTKSGLDIANNAEGKSNSTSTIPDPSPSKTVDQPSDPGYALALKDSPLLTQLGNIITHGPNDGVDWAHVNAAPPAADQSKGETDKSSASPDMMAFLISQLDFSRQSSSLTGQSASTELKSILDEGLKVAKEVEAAAKANSGAPAPVDAAADQVKQWQTQIKDVVSRVSALAAQAAALPGTGGALGASMTQPTTASNASSTFSAAKSLLDGATNRMTIAQQALSSSLTNYTAASTELSNVQEELGKVKADLATYQAQAHTLAEVVAVLTLVTTVLIDFKTEINKLVLHFQALTTLVNSVIDDQFNPFMRRLQLQVDNSSASVAQGGLGGISMSDLARHTFYVSGCVLAAYFDVFGDVAATYVQVSQQFVTGDGGGMQIVGHAGGTFPQTKKIPGAESASAPVDETGADSDPLVQAEMTRRLAVVSTWEAAATDGINKVLQNNNDVALKHINDHLTQISQKIKELPPADPHVVAAVQAGASVVTTAVGTAIQHTLIPLTAAPNVARSDAPIGRAHRGV